MKLADGNKPINIGDPSYIYKGVYNPIYWIGKEPYRPRVETLVIKDARYVYADIDDNIESYPSDLRYKHYSLPGGSLDSDSSHIEQAEAETNEEALVKVSLMYNTGVMYYELYEPGFILKGGDTPLEYVGSISEIFLGVYDGEYDKSKVDPKDLDPKMAEHGKFHDIISISKYLRKEHIEALVHSKFVDPDIKTILNLNRKDIINESTNAIIVPDRYIYHASTCYIEEFKPMSLDLGNLYDNPGWSTFCFDKYVYARVFGLYRAIQKWAKEVKLDINPIFNKGHIVFNYEDFQSFLKVSSVDTKFSYYVYTIDSEPLDIGIGNDKTLREYTFREFGIKPTDTDEVSLSLLDISDCVDIEDKDTPDEDNPYTSLLSHEYNEEDEIRDILYKAIDDGELKPGDDVVKYMEDNGLSFKNDDVKLPDITCDIDEPVLESNTDIITYLLEESFPIECYGLPDRKAYPMPDKKHVLSAIKFFNYAKKDEEKELADNINKKIKEFKMTDINVGEKNRFKSYYKPITEQFSLKDYCSIIESLNKDYNNTSKSMEERHDLMESTKSVIRMMIHNAEAGVLGNVESLGDIINESYSAIAELTMNQMELMTGWVNESKDVSTLESTIVALLEAGEDDEEDTDETPEDDTEEENPTEVDGGEDTETNDDDTPTDYEALADEGPEEEENPDDQPTDYEAMADETPDEEPEDTDTGEEEDPTEVDGGEDAEEDIEPQDDTEDTPTEEPDETIENEPDTTEDDTETEDTGDTEEGTTDDTGVDEEPTDYENMADDGGDDTDTDDMGDNTDDTTESDTETDTTDSENDENNNRYDNKELKNYFLLNSFLSIHEVVLDVLDSVTGVILPSREANAILAKVVKNLQSILDFVEKFIQFHFSDTDYAFNLYYYNLLISSLKLNNELLEEAFKDQENQK